MTATWASDFWMGCVTWGATDGRVGRPVGLESRVGFVVRDVRQTAFAGNFGVPWRGRKIPGLGSADALLVAQVVARQVGIVSKH